MSESIDLLHVTKRYGDLTIISDLSASIRNGEFFTLLGPSGCGKTTLLRMIAGFNSIEGGTISFGGRLINDVPAHKRNIGMVFQDYAIFPHMTVEQNVRYGLKFRDLSRGEADERVEHVMETVQIAALRARLPEQLSGGQQQRVALARAIVIHPTVLLMDEPLSNLDAKLRIEMRGAIRDVQRKMGITTVYVTHDQEEALAISDRIAVMKAGVIQQTASPFDIYTHPANTFVAGFIGHSDFFNVSVSGNSVSIAPGYSIAVPGLSFSGAGVAGVRPEGLFVAPEGLTARVLKRVFLGRYVIYNVELPDCNAVAGQKDIELSLDAAAGVENFDVGDTLHLGVRPGQVNVYDAVTGMNLMAGDSV